MKRNMDLIRDLLLKLESLPMERGGVIHIEADSPALIGISHGSDEVEYHLRLIQEAGFLDLFDTNPMFGIYFSRLSWEGHDFVDSVRSDAVWQKTKGAAERTGAWTLDIVKDLAKGFVKKQIEEYTGVKL